MGLLKRKRENSQPYDYYLNYLAVSDTEPVEQWSHHTYTNTTNTTTSFGPGYHNDNTYYTYDNTTNTPLPIPDTDWWHSGQSSVQATSISRERLVAAITKMMRLIKEELGDEASWPIIWSLLEILDADVQIDLYNVLSDLFEGVDTVRELAKIGEPKSYLDVDDMINGRFVYRLK